MLIIHDNELIHADNFDDIIQHFGIKGMKYREELYRSSRKDLMDKSGYYVHERTMSNSFINNYGSNASMYGGRAAEYQRMARKAGLKG